MTAVSKGLIALLLSNIIWGLSPLYYKLLDHVPPLEILSHRTLWSLILFALFLALQGRFKELPQALNTWRKLGWIALGAAMISINWSVFIWAIQVDRVVETSLGYFIFPLISVLFGVILFRERMGAARIVAITLATTAVVTLTIGLGVPPLLSLLIATSFGIYGVIKKISSTRPMVSVTGEVLVVAPLSLIWLWGVHNYGWTALTVDAVGAFGASWWDSLLLVVSGPLTAIPLMLFSYATKRLNLSTVGIMQYINPSLQFLVAVVILTEPFTGWHAIAFPLIWTGLAIYTVDAIRQDRAARKTVIASSTS